MKWNGLFGLCSSNSFLFFLSIDVSNHYLCHHAELWTNGSLRLDLPSDSSDCETWISRRVTHLTPVLCSHSTSQDTFLSLLLYNLFFFSFIGSLLTDGWELWVAVVQHLPGIAAVLGIAERHRWRYGEGGGKGGGGASSAVVRSPPRSGWNASASGDSSRFWAVRPTSDMGPVLWIIKSRVELRRPRFRHIILFFFFFVWEDMHLLC